MLKVIINADDFGINESITLTTKEMIERGVISSATIMANGTCLDLVKIIAKEHPEISYGVHLCLDEFESVTKNPLFIKYGMMDKSGFFMKNVVQNIVFIPRELKKAIICELSAQIEKIIDLGIPLSHLDTHHHWHMKPQLSLIFLEIAQKYKFKRIRFVKYYVNFSCIKGILGPLKVMIKDTIWCWLVFYKCRKPTYFFSYYDFYKKIIMGKKIKDDTVVELMVHPGNINSDRFLCEDDLLRKNVLKDIICYDMINYFYI